MSAFRTSLLSPPRTTGSDASRRSTAGDSFLTTEERHVYAQLYKAADPENKGVITGSEAVAFFAKSNVPPNVLADVCRALCAAWRLFIPWPSWQSNGQLK